MPDNRIKEGIGEKRRSGPGASEILLAFTIPGDSYLSVIWENVLLVLQKHFLSMRISLNLNTNLFLTYPSIMMRFFLFMYQKFYPVDKQLNKQINKWLN